MEGKQQQQRYNVTVIGIGAMGGGMARALLNSKQTLTVTGYDRSTDLVDAFYAEAVAAGKALPSSKAGSGPTPAYSLKDAITPETHFVLLVLLNEDQCQEVCFGKTTADQDDDNLFSLVPDGCAILSCATVTAAWPRRAHERFIKENDQNQNHRTIHFVDCPTSGGPVRAREGDLTLIVSASNDESIVHVRPILDVLGRQSDVHIVKGGVGMASTVKMVHQLLAGVHICAAAEALALAAAAGLDVDQVYDIVKGAAGASWMFQDRGARMIKEQQQQQQTEGIPVKSMLDIFVKDLDIVYSEAKRLQSPIPLASAALQQFISGQSLGLGRCDDSQVVSVYETVTGKRVQSTSNSSTSFTVSTTMMTTTESPNDAVTVNDTGTATASNSTITGDDYWIMEDGTKEAIVEVGSEPRHKIVLHNDYIRALRVSFPPHDTTLAHRHAEDSLYFFLVDVPNGMLRVVNHVQGLAPCCDGMEFGEVRYGTHRSEKPLVHKITNTTNQQMLCIDAEVLKSPPVTAAIPLMADKHELIKTRDTCRVYKLTLDVGESVTVSYPFFHCTVVLKPGRVEKETGGCIRWTETSALGDVAWKEPVVNLKKTNVGTEQFVEFIAEWR